MIILNYLENASFCSKVNASTALSLGGMCIESPPASFHLVKSLTKHMRPYQQIDLASKVPGSDIWILYPPLGNSFALSWRSPIRIRTSGTADGEIAGYRSGAGRVEDSLQMLYLSLNSSLAQDDLVHFFMDKPFNTMGPYIYLPTAGGLDACLGKLNSVATCFFVELLKPSFSAWDTIKTDFPVFPSFPKFVNHHFTG